MLYNKRQFRKANDKKVLRKVGKQWKTVSLALLMAIGGVGIATQVSHASAVNNNNRPNVNNQNTLKERLNSSLQKTTLSNRSVTADHSQSKVRQTPQVSTQNITNQASALHNRIIRNASQSNFNAQGQKQQTGSSVQRTANSNQNSQNNDNAVQKAIAQSAAVIRNQQAASNQSGSAAPASGSSVQTSNGSKVNTSVVSIDNPVNTGNQAGTKDATGKNTVKTNDQRNNQTVNGPKEEPTNMPNVGDQNTVTVNYMYDGNKIDSHAFHKGDVINADDVPGLQSGYGINPDPQLAAQSYMIGQDGKIIGQDNDNINVDRVGNWGSAHWYINTDHSDATLTLANGSLDQTAAPGDFDSYTNENNIRHIYTYNAIAPSDSSCLFAGSTGGGNGENHSGATCQFNNLESVDLSGLNTSNVTDMGGMFHGDVDLVHYNFTGVNTSKVTTMGEMFDDNCRASNLDLNWMDTSNCSNFELMFWNMPSMSDLDINKFVINPNADLSSFFSLTGGYGSSDHSNNGEYPSDGPIDGGNSKLREIVIGPKVNLPSGTITDVSGIPSGAWDNVSPIPTESDPNPTKTISDLSNLNNAANPGAWIYNKSAVTYHIKYQDVLTGNTVATKTGHTVLGLHNVRWVPVNNVYLPTDQWGHQYRFVPAQGMTVPVTVPNQQITVNVFDPQPDQNQDGNNIVAENVWGRTNWFLYGNGTLRLVDNSMETNQAPSSPSDNLRKNMSSFPVHTLKVTNAVAPGDASGTFSGHQNGFSDVSDLGVNNLNTTSTYKMDSMMSDMPNVKNMDLSNWSTNGVQSMNNMFASDTNLTNLNVSGFKMGPNTSTTNMFKSTNNLQSITIGPSTRFNQDSSMSQKWINQDTGQQVNLEDGKTHLAGTYYNGNKVSTQKVNVEYTFGPGNVIEGKTEYLPTGTTVDKASINPPNKHWILDPNDPQQIGINNSTLAVNLDRFGHWGSANWYMDYQGNMKLYNSANGNSMLTNQWNGPQNHPSDEPTALYRNMVKSITTSDVMAPSNSSNLFHSMPNLQSVNFSGLDAANTTSFNHMLANDPKLSDAENLGHLSTGNNADMTGMLASDDSLKSIDLTGIDTGKVNNFSSMFANDKVLSDVGLSGASIAKANDMQSMFANDPQLRALDLSGFDNSNPSNITMTNMFQGDNLLSELKMPDRSQFNFSGKNFKSTGIPFFSNNKHSNGSNSTDDMNNGNQSADTYYYGNDDIIVNYINETGQTLHTDDILGRLEDPVDIFTTKDTHGSDGNPDPSDYTIDRKDTKPNYTFLDHPQHVTVPLIGKYTNGRQYQTSNSHGNPITKNYNNQSDDNNKVTLTFNEVNSDGQKIGNSLGTKTIYVKGQIGNDVSINPSDYLNDVNGRNGPEYVVASDSNGSTVSYYLQGNGRNPHGKPDTATLYGVNGNGAPYQLNKDGSLKTDAQGHPILIPANRSVTFDYIANPNYSNKIGNLIVKYVDHNNNQIGSTDTITPTASDYGQSIDVTNPKSTLPNKPSAKGEAVPAGYHIDAAQPTRYTITHSDQNITLNVDGDPETTNSSDTNFKLPITVKVVNHKSDGSTESDYYTSKTSFNKNNPTSQQPKISSKIGQSVVLDASTYQPQINSNQIINNSDSSYRINFTMVSKSAAHGKTISVPGITATKNDGTTLDNHDLNTKGITFTYNLYQQEAPRYTNTIHYISSSDIDNSDDITRQPGQSTPFLTKVSDRGTQKNHFSDKYYRENVPIGYQFYKVYSVNGKRVDGTNSSGISGFGKNTPSGNQDEVIEVIPNAKPIHIHYINQNGSDLKDYTSDGISQKAINSVDTGDQYTTKFGKQISDNTINQPEQNKNSIGVPQGYHYAALHDSQNQPINPEAQPTFSRNEQNVYIPIVGNTYPVKVQIRRNTTDANNQSDFSVVSDTINNAQVGHEYTLYGFNFTPTNQNAGSGYTIDTSNGRPFKVTVKIDPNDQYHYVDDTSDSTGGDALNDKSQNIDNKEIGVDNQGNPNSGQNPANFWFTVSNNVSKPLHLVYVNQAGQKVGCSDKIQGTIGTQVNVTDPSKGGEPIPHGYQLTDGSTPNETLSDKSITRQTSNSNKDYRSDVTGNDQDTSYQLSNHEQTVFLHVTGQPIKASVKIYKVLEDSDGHQHVMPGSETISGDLGSSVEVNPSDYLKELPGNDNKNDKNYQVDYNRDSTQFVRLGNLSEDPNKGIATPNRIVFYYRSSQTSGAPITVRYINDQTGQQVSDSYTDVMNGNLNTDADVTSVAAGGEAVPNGYSIDKSKLSQLGTHDGTSDAPKYKFSTSPRNLNIPVEGDTLQQSDTFTLQIVKRDPDEDSTAQVSDVRLKIDGHVGDTFTISPYGFSDGKKNIITGMQGNGVTNKINGKSLQSDHWLMPSGYHAVDSDADLKVQIRPDGTLSPLSNTSYTYVANYDPINVGTVNVHYVTSDTGAPSDGQSSSIPSKVGSGLKELDVESDRGIVPDSNATQAQVKQGDQFDLTPYKNDIPETIPHFFDYQIDKSTPPMDASGTKITDDQWSFSKGTKDVYIKVDKKGDQPIIID